MVRLRPPAWVGRQPDSPRWSGLDEDLEGLAVGHRAVAICNIGEIERAFAHADCVVQPGVASSALSSNIIIIS
jgi:hypothetical protein